MRGFVACALAILLAAFGLVAISPPAQAAETTSYYVDGVDGSDVGVCASPQQACKTIGYAVVIVTAAMIFPGISDATVHIAAGSYIEKLDISGIPSGHTLALAGADRTTTVIDGGGDGTVIRVNSGALELSRLTITHGAGGPDSGGGIHAGPGTIVQVTNSTIISNAAENGGGVHAGKGATVELDGTLIRDNYATHGGGLSADDDSVLTVTNSTITANKAAEGGGIHALDGSEVRVTKSTVNGNAAREIVTGGVGDGGTGGGFFVHAGDVRVHDTTIADNQADGSGGAFFMSNSPEPAGSLELVGSTLNGNSAPTGGGITSYGGDIAITNSTLSGNFTVPQDLGSGSIAAADSTITITASTVAGGNIHGGGATTIADSILFGLRCQNTIDGGYNVASHAGCVGEGTGSRLRTTEDIALGPLTRNLSDGPATHAIPMRGPSHSLVPGQRCQPIDQRGFTRILAGGTHCDAGAFERQIGFTSDFYVDQASGDDSRPCGEYTPCRTISRALDRAVDEMWAGATEPAIWISSGTYREDLELRAQYDATLMLFGAGADRTVIEGTGAGPVIAHFDGPLTLRGMTITGGDAEFGGGVYSSAPDGVAIDEAAIVGNTANVAGGVFAAALTMTNSTVSGNTATTRGAVVGTTIGITNSTIRDNGTRTSGAIIAGEGNLIASTIAGGAISLSGGNGSLTVSGSVLSDVRCNGVTDGGYNVASDDSCIAQGTGSIAQSVEKIGLSPLALDAPGGTRTSAIGLFSTARAIVPAEACVETDQRGHPRLAATRDAPYCDAGAYERQPSDPVGALPGSAPPFSAYDADTYVRVHQNPSQFIVPLQEIDIKLSGFAPVSDAVIVIFSSPTILGHVTTDDDGIATATVVIPAGLSGTHTIVAAGMDRDRRAIFPQQVVRIGVTSSGSGLAATGPPQSMPRVAAGGAMMIVVGTALTVVAASRRRRASS